MKRIVAVCVSLVLFLASCSGGGSNADSDRVRELESELAALKQQIGNQETQEEETTARPTTSVKQTTTTKATTTAPPVENDIGSRKNPAKVGEHMILFGTYDFNPIEVDVLINSVTRGEEAYNIVMEENSYNEIPEGYEAILINMTVTLTKYDSPDDSSYYVSYFDGTFFTSDYKQIQREESIVVPNELDGELYEGASITGNIPFVAPIGEAVLYRYQDTIWFDIGN